MENNKNNKKLKNFIKTTIREFLNEAYIDKDGNLQDMNYEPSSDDLWDDKKFLSFVNKNLEYGDEMPEKLYKELSDNHKKLYRKELLDYGGQMVGYSENEALLKDLVKYDYDRLSKETMEWVELFPEMGSNSLPFYPLFIKSIDEILQGRIINKLAELMEWDLHIVEEQFNSFHPRIKKLIEDNEYVPFVLDF